MKLCALKVKTENFTFLKMENGVASGDSANLAGRNMNDPECNRKLKRAKEILLHKRELEWH